jgi:mannose-6-phosphate isomerase
MPMPTTPLTPLRFTPIFKSAVWGGARLRSLFHAPPSDQPTGEAWLLSDQGDTSSVVANGPFAGKTLRQLMVQFPTRIVGKAPAVNGRFPLLLKFLHAREPLSVQVHPTDAKARELEGPTAVGKTEAWLILEADPTARLFAGLQPGTTLDRFRGAIQAGTVEDLLYVTMPEAGDCVFLPAGTVHAIGGGLLLFEIQQTSDLTYRLYDWGRVDPKSGKPRDLHVGKGLASIDFSIGPCRASRPTSEGHGRVRPEKLAECGHFTLDRWDTDQPFRAGVAGKCRVLVGVHGRATLKHAGTDYLIALGDVLMLPAEVGACEVVPTRSAMILECGLVE